MKCLFAVPNNNAVQMEKACAVYAQELNSWAPSVLATADDLALFVKAQALCQMCLNENDWNLLRAKLDKTSKGQALAQIFWHKACAEGIADAVEALGSEATTCEKALLAWLITVVHQDAVIVALTM